MISIALLMYTISKLCRLHQHISYGKTCPGRKDGKYILEWQDLPECIITEPCNAENHSDNQSLLKLFSGEQEGTKHPPLSGINWLMKWWHLIKLSRCLDKDVPENSDATSDLAIEFYILWSEHEQAGRMLFNYKRRPWFTAVAQKGKIGTGWALFV